MKPRYKAGGLVAGVTVLGGVGTAAAFVLVGSRIAVYAAVAILPVLVVVGALWVQSVATGTASGEGRIARREARSVGREFEEFWGRYRTAREAMPRAFEETPLGVDRVVSKLDDNGVDFDRGTGTASTRRFTLLSGPDIESLSAIRDDIDELDRELDRTVRRGAEAEIERLTEALERLEDLVAVSPPTAPEDAPDPTEDDVDRRAVFDVLSEHERYVEDRLEAAAEAIRETLAETGTAGDADVDGDLDAAASAVDAGDYVAAVEHLESARNRVHRVGDDRFTDRKRELLALVDTVESASLPSAELAERADRISEIGAEIEELASATDAAELRTEEERLRSECLDLVAALQAAVSEALSTLERADVPDTYYSRPPGLDREFADELRDAESLSAFRDAAAESIALLTDRLDALGPKADVAGGYDAIAERIEEELRRTGAVESDDVPVREYEAEFMRLYAAKHPSVRFDPDGPSLRLPEGGESYDLAVTVTLAAGGDETALLVEAEGADYRESKEVTTADAAQVIFESVPFGEYAVRVTPRSDEFETAEETVTVDDETTSSFLLSQVSPIDRLCEGIDDPDRLLSELESRVAERFERREYLDGSVDLPIDDDYVGCLLARWGEANGKDVVIDDDEVVVYDHEQLLDELRRVANHNIDPGERIPFDELRERYLSGAVPDGRIRAACSEIDALGADERGISREDQ